MRRAPTFFVLLVAVLLAAPSVAGAATRYEGDVRSDEQARVAFTKRGGVVDDFTVHDVRFVCTDNDAFNASTRVGAMTIREADQGERFKGHFFNSPETQRAKVRGLLLSERGARGTVEVIAQFGAHGCTTGKLRWKATPLE